jgi:hypothetical protein
MNILDWVWHMFTTDAGRAWFLREVNDPAINAALAIVRAEDTFFRTLLRLEEAASEWDDLGGES